jgi:hypothetical protein
MLISSDTRGFTRCPAVLLVLRYTRYNIHSEKYRNRYYVCTGFFTAPHFHWNLLFCWRNFWLIKWLTRKGVQSRCSIFITWDDDHNSWVRGDRRDVLHLEFWGKAPRSESQGNGINNLFSRMEVRFSVTHNTSLLTWILTSLVCCYDIDWYICIRKLTETKNRKKFVDNFTSERNCIVIVCTLSC